MLPNVLLRHFDTLFASVSHFNSEYQRITGRMTNVTTMEHSLYGTLIASTWPGRFGIVVKVVLR